VKDGSLRIVSEARDQLAEDRALLQLAVGLQLQLCTRRAAPHRTSRWQVRVGQTSLHLRQQRLAIGGSATKFALCCGP